MEKANVVIAGDEIRAGIDMNDVKETVPIKLAMVIQFDSIDAMRDAMKNGHVEFDFMRPNAGGNATERSEGRVDHNVGRHFGEQK